MSRESQVEHIDMLVDLLERQKVMYTRLSLSDDPEAKQMKDDLKKSIMVMGFPDGTDMPYLFEAMHKTCLLYTSPSPRDRQKSRMPSSA